MNAKKAKKMRRKAQELTAHLPEITRRDIESNRYTKQSVLGECQRGAYKAIKKGRVNVAV